MSNKALSSEYLVILIEFLAERYFIDQATFEKLLSFDLEPYLIERSLVEFDHYAEAFAQSFLLTQDYKFHLHYAEILTTDRHGLLGYYAQSQRCFEDAIIAHVKYLKTRFNYVRYQLVKGEVTSIVLIDVSLESPLLRQITVECVLKSMQQNTKQWLGYHSESISVLLEYPGNNFISDKEPYEVSFSYDQPINGILIPNSVLAMPLKKYDPTLSRLCEQELKKDVSMFHEREGYADIVKSFIHENVTRPCSLHSVASEFCISDRSLNRLLNGEGTNFRQLLNECKMERALVELTSRSVSRVSELLGFQNQFSFSRAFKKWTGRSPSEYRSAQQERFAQI